MGHKIVCLDCRKAFSLGTDLRTKKETVCPDCKKEALYLSHRFRPPKKTDDKKWEVVEFLVKNGFSYQHIYEEQKNTDSFVTYPENLRDAKEFIERFKNHKKK